MKVKLFIWLFPLIPGLINAQEDKSQLGGGLKPVCDDVVNLYLAPQGLTTENTIDLSRIDSFDLSTQFLAKDWTRITQGKQGSCTSFAVAFTVSIQRNIDNYLLRNRTGLTQFSPAFIFNMAKANYSEPFKSNCQDGISYIDAFLIVRDKGVPQLNLYPYTPSSKGCSENPKPTKTAYSDAVKTKIAIFQRPVRNIDNFKRILVDTPFYPICIGTVLSSEYDHAVENGGMWKAKGISTGKRLHAMLIVGFNNKKNAFKVMDWQGDKYGDKGFIWLDYSLIDNPNVVFDAYICSHQTEYLDYRIGSRTGSATEEDTSQSAIPNSVFVNDQVQFWIKSGYYTQKDRFKITCLFVGDGVNKATFRVEDNKTNLLVKDNIMISEGSSKCFDYEGVTYKLKLLEIANRGKNIFKKAAIVNFTRNVVCETNNIINNKTQ